MEQGMSGDSQGKAGQPEDLDPVVTDDDVEGHGIEEDEMDEAIGVLTTCGTCIE
jgi:hypothetical protein